MDTAALPCPREASPRERGRRLAWLETLLVWGVLCVEGGWAPPDPNEPHYLGKARHYWDASWCAGDFFLESADSHVVFYWTCGWATLWLPLPVLAWIGRLAVWAGMAFAWRRLSWRLAAKPGLSVLTAALYVMLIDHFQMAGEWVVGGFEAKSVAYALVFMGLGDMALDRWRRAWLWFGAAAAFHVLVGGWSVVAAGIAWLAAGKRREPLRNMWPGLAGGLLLSLAGVLPALALSRGADPELVDRANIVYVFGRLKHHLDPLEFKRWFVARHGILAAALLLLGAQSLDNERLRRIRQFAFGALAIALSGVAIFILQKGDPAQAARWARFYWFRMSDSMLPLGVAFSCTASAAGLARWRRPNGAAVCLTLLCGAAGWHLFDLHRQQARTAAPRADKSDKVVNHADWREACEWAGRETPADARFITPRLAQTFKWWASRPEVVNWKDIPQDAAGIVEWQRRLREIHGIAGLDEDAWQDTLATERPDRLRRLADRYEADYLITEAEPPLALPLLHRNATYAIYALR